MKKIFTSVLIFLAASFFVTRFVTSPAEGAPPASELQKYIFELPRVTYTSGNDDLVSKIRLQVTRIVAENNHSLISARLWGTGNQLLWGHGRAVAAISQTLPYLDSSLAASTKTFLASDISQYLLNQNYISTKEVASSSAADHGFVWSGNAAFCWEALYGLWSYGFYSNDWSAIQTNWNTVKSIYGSCAQNGNRVLGTTGVVQTTSAINSEIVGNIAMARMAKQFNDSTTQTTAASRATTLLGTKIDQVAASSNNPVTLKGGGDLGRFLTIEMYQDLTPELGRAIKDYQKAKATTQVSTITNRFRTWFMSDMDHVSDWMAVAPFPPITDSGARSGEEGYQMSLFANPIFMLKAYTTDDSLLTLKNELPLGQSSKENGWYLDIIRLQHLVALMHKAGGITWSL